MGTCLLKVYDQVKLIQPDLRQPTQEERRRGVEDALAQLDSNGDGKLEKSEFDRFVLVHPPRVRLAARAHCTC